MEFKSLLGPQGPEKRLPNNSDGPKKTANKGSVPPPGTHSGSASGHRWGLWAAVGLLAVALGAAVTRGYEEIEADRALFPDFAKSGAVDAIQVQIESIDGRLSNLASRVATSDVVEGLVTRVFGIERTLTRGLEATQGDIARIREANADIEWRIQSSVEDRTSRVRERLAELESAEQSRLAEIAGLRDTLEGIRLELALELVELRGHDAAVAAGLEQRISGTERRLDIVAYAVERDRVDFEMYEGFAEELAPGIHLHLNEVDRRYQKVGGWIQLIPEGRFIRINDQSIQESLVFYTHQDERPHELVFTRVTETAAVGYMRLPSDSVVQSADETWDQAAVAAVAND
jgi:hypothetical protein